MITDSFDSLWEDYYAKSLSAHEVNQFRQARRKPLTHFLNQIIKPMAYAPDRGTYLCISDRVDVPGRSFVRAKILSENGSDVDWAIQQFFTNSLRTSQHGDADFNHPSERVAMAPYHVFTFEFDSEDLAFFRQQLGWFRSPKHRLDSPIGKFFKDLRAEFKDCVGLNVTYSGNKSFHYHLIFSTDLLATKVPSPTSLRHGIVQTWDKLAQIILSSPHLSIPEGFYPDSAPKHPEWFRRLPGGSRTISAKLGETDPSHMFGVPNGEVVPQVVMWEHLTRKRSGRGEDQTSVFRPAEFLLTAPTRMDRKIEVSATPFELASAAEQFCAEKMAAIYDGEVAWPRFEGFRHERGEVRAYFANHAADQNPTSFMGADHATVFIQGGNPLGLMSVQGADGTVMPRLPRELGEMLRRWSEEYREIHEPVPSTVKIDRERTAVEQAFADAAKDHASATAAISKVLDQLVLTDIAEPQTHFLSAPEGISKTRSLMASTARHEMNLNLRGCPTLIMYAFASYEIAREKCQEFNLEYGASRLTGRTFKGVVLPSFSELYREACKAHDLAAMTSADAANYGHPSLMRAVEVMQHDVMAHFRKFHKEIVDSVGDAQMVIFAVHQVAHGWVKNNPTRLMLSPQYWRRNPNENEVERQVRLAVCRDQTRLGLLVHDEVSAENLVVAAPASLVMWIETMREANTTAWAKGGGLRDRLKAFEAFRISSPPPMPITFERACEMVEIVGWDRVTTRYSGEYGHRIERLNRKTGELHPDIYLATAGRDWCIAVRDWPSQTAHRTIVLTTEKAPAHLVRRIGAPWQITELDTPLISRDEVEVHASRHVVGGRLAKLVKERQDAHFADTGRELLAISNKSKHLANTKTHAGAKGSNSYMAKDVIQTMAMMAPEQYEFYEALNAWCGRADLVRTRHMDEYQQSAGRNLGFRKRDGARHILLINSTLNECLEGEHKACSRYVMREPVSRRAAKVAKNAATRVQPPVAPRPASKAKVTGARQALLSSRTKEEG